ncbi:hypothetical protein RhiJN_16302 [Ceratobasidium sp. AG-Ba]|nr:hypothetical protein RhiJN_16302 [Ceratobasidium sp. AG-Ba]
MIQTGLLPPEVSDELLLPVQVFNMLMQLDELLRSLPSALPLPLNGQSCYAKLVLFHPLPSHWVEDIGPVSTVNRQLEVVFGDIILQKWLWDLVQAATNAHTLAKHPSTNKDCITDLTGETSDEDALPNSKDLISEVCQNKRDHSISPVPEESVDEQSDVEPEPMKKNRKTQIKRKGPLPPRDDIKAIPSKVDSCDYLKGMDPELHECAIQALAEYSITSLTSVSTISATSGENSIQTSSSLLPRATHSDIFASFWDQGELDFRAQATLATVCFICATGVPPRILDSPKWRHYNSIILAKTSSHRYCPPSATTMSDKLIPARAAQVTLDVRQILSNQSNLTLSFDGLTKGNQTFYTVHVITQDRHVFLYAADVKHESQDDE